MLIIERAVGGPQLPECDFDPTLPSPDPEASLRRARRFSRQRDSVTLD